MPNRESQRLDKREIWLSDQTIDVDTQHICNEFGVDSRTRHQKV